MWNQVRVSAFVTDYGLWSFMPLSIVIILGWVVYCCSQLKRAYHTWKYQQQDGGDVDVYNNSRTALIRNALLLSVVLIEGLNMFTVFTIENLFATRWLHNKQNLTIYPNCELDKNSWLYDFERVSWVNWILEGMRQALYITELILIRVTILHLESAYRKEKFILRKMVCKSFPFITSIPLVLALSAFSQSYSIGFGLSLVVIQIIMIQIMRDFKRLLMVISWEIKDSEYASGRAVFLKSKKKLLQIKKIQIYIYMFFQTYIVSLFLYLIVVLLLQTVLLNPCWMQHNYHFKIPEIQFKKDNFYTACYIVWMFRTVCGIAIAGMLALFSVSYFCRVVFGRVRVEIRVSKLCRCMYRREIKQPLLV